MKIQKKTQKKNKKVVNEELKVDIIPEKVLENKLVKVKKIYFTNDVDKAIIEYNACTDF